MGPASTSRGRSRLSASRLDRPSLVEQSCARPVHEVLGQPFGEKPDECERLLSRLLAGLLGHDELGGLELERLPGRSSLRGVVMLEAEEDCERGNEDRERRQERPDGVVAKGALIRLGHAGERPPLGGCRRFDPRRPLLPGDTCRKVAWPLLEVCKEAT